MRWACGSGSGLSSVDLAHSSGGCHATAALSARLLPTPHTACGLQVARGGGSCCPRHTPRRIVLALMPAPPRRRRPTSPTPSGMGVRAAAWRLVAVASRACWMACARRGARASPLPGQPLGPSPSLPSSLGDAHPSSRSPAMDSPGQGCVHLRGRHRWTILL
ncbi:hypothetical protein BS78_02G005800 [Paspalum vaginatum]|nr:hypothetical protein BS78_02G005800 [Paspalum vaginatum]